MKEAGIFPFKDFCIVASLFVQHFFRIASQTRIQSDVWQTGFLLGALSRHLSCQNTADYANEREKLETAHKDYKKKIVGESYDIEMTM